MSKNKYTDFVCIAVVVAMLALTVILMFSPSQSVTASYTQPEYVDKLFSTDKVHTIDIRVTSSDWDNMLDNAQNEEYIHATVVIDGETVSSVGIRPKGNSSLAMIASANSDRFSFKIEFDHFSNSINYYGLDKLALNNIAQDNTYMKDYITYQIMNEMGADAPLSSFIWITVNDEDWGLYLAVEAVEESFAQRVYGDDFGEIYKPDSMDMNGDNRFPGNQGDANFPGGGQIPDISDVPDGFIPNYRQIPDFGDSEGDLPPMPEFENNQNGNTEQDGLMQNWGAGINGGATSLVYSNDDPDSYSAIFDNALFTTSESDKNRLIESLKQLNEGVNIDQVVDVDEVIRYFVVHNFVLNSDSYTGSLVHNYYLSENDGQLSMIAWDYNLAFGGMGGMGMGRGPNGNFGGNTNTGGADTATALVNYPIDSPMLSGSIESKPMIAWIFENDEYLAQYHEVYNEYMAYFSSGKFTEMFDNAITLISPYVKKDSTAFCTFDEFQKGSSSLREFCILRAESISGQLKGIIASTSEEQSSTGNANFIDASSVDMESMGSNEMGFGRDRGTQFPR